MNAGVKKPRFSVESPGPLAEAEAQWLLDAKGIEVTAAQVRGILMYHGEFQKSEVRAAQRKAEQEAKAKRDAEHRARAAERQEKLADRLAKAKERVAELERLASGIESTGAASPEPEEPKPASVRRNSKAPAKTEALSA
ncbi:hypothetical protein [Mycobacterium sp. URHB0021]